MNYQNNFCDEYKKKYIVNNINSINDQKKILDYIFFKNITHSENNNGYLINISKLSIDHINNIYYIIYNIIENNNDFDNKEKEEYKMIFDTNNYINTNDIYEYTDIEIKDFNNNQIHLIKKSRNYKFE